MKQLPQPTHSSLSAAAWVVLVVLVCLPACTGLDVCLTKPWQFGSSLPSESADVVSLITFEDLQQHINEAQGPATFVLQATDSPVILANLPVHINKSAITIAASLDWLRYSDSQGEGPPPARLQVACGSTAGSLLQIEQAQAVRILGLHVSGCSTSAIQLDTAKKVVLQGCLFNANSNSTSGGAISAVRSQVWVDSCAFQANTAAGGSGGAILASFSHILVTDSNFSSNSAGVSGGAVALRGRSTDAAAAAASLTAASQGTCWKDTDAILHNVGFSSNRAKLQGGAIAANGTHIIVQTADASNNKARYGGVAYLGQTAQLTVRGGSSMVNNTAASSGGVVYAVSPGARVALVNSTFTGNAAKILGGVVSAKEAASVRLDDCTFQNNTADLAAGVVYAKDSGLTATGCTFGSNSAKRDGGALYCAGGCLWRLRSCIFSDNECGANGGAFFGWNVEASISSSSLVDNSAGSLGGGVAVANSTLELKGCKLGSNTAYGSDAAGGGLYSQGSTLNVTDCFMAGNVASWGGAVYITNSTLSLVGGAIANSSATGSGAALYVLRSGVSVSNTTLSYNDAQQYGGSMFCSDSVCSVSGCEILGDSAGQGGGCVWVGGGSLHLRRSHLAGCVSATDDGGGVHAAAASSVTVAGVSIKGCSALKGSGGAMWLSGVRAVSIRGSLFAQNQAMYGGSLYISNSSAILGSSSVINSTATVGGGIAATMGSELTLFNNTAVAGNAAAVGGGIAVDSTHLTITGPVAVSWNKALRPTLAAAVIATPSAAAASAVDTSSAAAPAAVSPSAVFGGQAVLRGLGAGLYAHNSRVLGSDLRLDRNTADRVGAGAYLDRCGAKIISSNISRNQAIEEAGGLKLLNPAQGSALLNCTVANNWAGLKGGGVAIVGVDLASEVALVGVQLLNNSASGQSGGGLWLNGPLGLLMVGGEVSGNTAGASAVAAAAAAAADGAVGSRDASLQAAGGGIMLEDCSWAALHGVGVYGNAALAGCGGGLALAGCGKFLLDSSTVLGNVAGSGGGMCAFDLLSFLTLHNSTISSNKVLLGGLWDAGAASTAALTPTPEPHLNCGVQGTGGGLCIASLGEVLINGTSITRNQARNGGAMALSLCSDGDRCSLGLVGAAFINNTAVQGGGGALYFSTAVSPYQVRCGEDYNTSSITGYARGTSFPSLSSLLESAAFIHGTGSSSTSNTSSGAVGTPVAAGGSGSAGSPGSGTSATTDPGTGAAPVAAGGSLGSSSSGGGGTAGINEGVDTLSPTPPPSSTSSGSSDDDILASTPGSQGLLSSSGGSSGGSSSGNPAGAAGDGSGGAATDTFAVDAGDGGGASSATTTVLFDGSGGEDPGAKVAGLAPAAAAALELSPAGSSPPPAATAAVLQSPTPGAGTARAEGAKAIGAGAAMSSTARATAQPSGSSSADDADIQASTAGFIPTAAAPDPGMFTIASVPEVRPAVKAPVNASQAAFQARSAKIAAGLHPQRQHKHSHRPANSTQHAGTDRQQSAAAVAAAATAGSSRHRSHQRAAEAQLPGTEMPVTADPTALAAVAGASAADSADDGGGKGSGDGKLDWELADASDGLRVIKRPAERSSSTTTTGGTGAEADVLLAAAQTTAAASRAAAGSSSKPGLAVDAQGMQLAGRDPLRQHQQQQMAGGRVPLTEATARTLAVPVTLPVLQAAEKAGVHPKVTTAWQRIGTVSLGTLMDAGVVDPALLSEFWGAYPKSTAAAAQASTGASTSAAASRATGWQHQFYASLAVVLSQAAALHADRVASGEGLAAARRGQIHKAYAACDPVQNPAACPVPKPPRSHEYPNPALRAAAGNSTPTAGAATAATASTQQQAGTSISSTHGRHLAALEDIIKATEEAAGNMTFMSTDVTSVGAAAPAHAGSNSFILQGRSQCGLFSHNVAIGARAYGPVVTSRPAGLRVWGSVTANDSSSILVATGGQLQVQVSVVDTFGGVVTSGAADFIRVRATLTPPLGSAAASSKNADLLSAAALTAASAEVITRNSPNREVDDNGVELLGLQQLSTSNGSLILSGLQLSGLPGTNTTLYIIASDPTLLPASLPITLTSCSAGYMQLPGQCQLCPVGTFSFTADEPLCSLCPVGASCNGTLLVPLAGYWQSTPRSAQVHACLNPAACARDALRQQQLADWQATHYGHGAIVGRSKDSLAQELQQYMRDQCAAGYSGRLCGVCTQEPAAAAANRVSHGMVGGACVACGERRTVISTFVLVRVFDLVLWAVLTFLACKAANAWAQATALNPATAAATAGSLPPSSAAGAVSGGGARSNSSSSKSAPVGGLNLVSSAAAAAATAEVPVAAALHTHVSVFMDYLQMLSVISASAASYAWPKALKTFMAAFAFVPLGTSRWVSAECLLPYILSYRHSIVGLLLTAALPLLYLIASAMVWLLGLFRGHTHRTALMALVVGTGLFYPLVTLSALSVFSCHTLDDSKAALPGEQLSAVGSYWTLDPELQCYQGQHLTLTLGFGLPVVLLVVFAWPLLLASMLWDSRFRIRDQQLHPATRRRYLVRKTIKMCHQILGVSCGFTRPRFYLWPVVVEVRKLLLCVVVVLVAGSPAPVQLYVLWGLLAVMLVLEWWVRPGATWPIVGLQLVALGAVQGVVYLASAFTQVSLAGSALTFTGLIIALCCMVAVALVLSLVASFRANTWLTKLLDADKDGKVSRQDLCNSAVKLLHLSTSHTCKDDHTSCDDKSGTGDGSTGSSSRRSMWQGAVLFFSKRRLAIAVADVAAAHDTDVATNGSGHDQAQSPSAGAAAGGRHGLASGRTSPLCRSPCLVANSLPIAHVTAGAAAAGAMGFAPGAAAGQGDGGVPTSSSIDMGMLAMLRQMNRVGSIDAAAVTQAAQQAEAAGSPQAQPFVAVDLGQLSADTAALQRESQQQRGRQQAGTMGRSNSVGAPGGGGGKMPLHAYMSVQQWLEQSEELLHDPRHPGLAAPGSADPARLDPSSRAHSMGRSRSLQLSASTPAPQVASLRSSSGSLAVQRQQLLQHLQQRHHLEPLDSPTQQDGQVHQEAVDLSTLRSVSESDPQQQQQQQLQQQRRRMTGPAAAARAREVATAASAGSADGAGGPPSPPGPAPAARHQPYYALWSSIASAIAGPVGSSDSAVHAGRPPPSPSGHSSSRASDSRQQSAHTSHSRRGVTPTASSATRSSAATRSMHSSSFIHSSISGSTPGTRVRSSPFATAAVVAAATGTGPAKPAGVRPSPFSAAAATAAPGVPAGRAASAPDVHASTAALAAAAAGAPSVSKGRHASYYSMWQCAMADASGGSPAATAAGVAAELPEVQQQEQQQQQHRPGMTAQSAATAPPVVLEPRRHKQYIGLWSALAEELGDGPSAVGAAAPGPVVPAEVAAAFAAAMAQSGPAVAAAAAPVAAASSGSSSTCPPPAAPQQQQQGRVRPSPFAMLSAATAVIGAEQAEGAAAGAADHGQEEQRRARRRRPGRRPRDSAGTCLGSDSD